MCNRDDQWHLREAWLRRNLHATPGVDLACDVRVPGSIERVKITTSSFGKQNDNPQATCAGITKRTTLLFASGQGLSYSFGRAIT